MKPDTQKSMTHIAWAQHFRGGKFRKWVEVGEGRFDVDADGQTTVHVFLDRTVIGDNGYFCLLPMGEKPPAPPREATRAEARSDDEN